MIDYLYGAETAAFVMAAFSVVDENIPNSLWYYIDLMLPF